MIRLFLLAAGFLSLTITLLVTQLGDPDDAGEDTTVAATRSNSSLLDAPDATSRDSTGQTTLRAEATEPRKPDDTASQIDMMTRSILTELRRPVTGDRLRQVASQTETQGEDMRHLTDSVLAGLGEVAPKRPKTTEPETGADSPQSLNTLITQAMRDGQSDAYVDALINEAVGKGEVAAPSSIVTSSGEVDTATILDSLVQKSDGSGAIPADNPAPEGDLTYVVQPGDSLAGIALRHYGTTTAHDIIFMANRDKLRVPSAIRPGMELTIPAL